MLRENMGCCSRTRDYLLGLNRRLADVIWITIMTRLFVIWNFPYPEVLSLMRTGTWNMYRQAVIGYRSYEMPLAIYWYMVASGADGPFMWIFRPDRNQHTLQNGGDIGSNKKIFNTLSYKWVIDTVIVDIEQSFAQFGETKTHICLFIL